MNAKKRIIFIIGLALVVQFVFLAFFDMPIVKDAKRYNGMAQNLSKGLGFTEDGVNPSWLYPGAPTCFALVYKVFGTKPMSVKISQAVLFSLLCVLVYFIGWLSFHEDMGFAAACVCALYPPLFALPDILLATFLFTFMLAAITLLFILCKEKNKPWIYCLTGFLCGALSYIRPNGLFLVFFLIAGALFWFRNAKKFLAFSVLAFMAFIIAILPITVRNYLHFGTFMPVSGIESVRVKQVSDEELKANEEFAKGAERRQYELVEKYYAAQGIEISPSEMEEKLEGPLAKLIPQDYTWRPKNIFDSIRRLYISSYSDIYQIGLPFAFFFKDKRLIEAYPGLFAWKTLNFTLATTLFFLAILGFLVTIKRFMSGWPLLIVIGYNTLFYLAYSFVWKSDLTTRYGLPVVPYIILYAVVGGAFIYNTVRHALNGWKR